MPYYAIIKKHVDRLDRMGFLKMGAPQNEYAPESRMIAERITEEMDAPQIAVLMAAVFAEMFSAKGYTQKEDPHTYADSAERIYADLHP